jgi:hypothetical protein
MEMPTMATIDASDRIIAALCHSTTAYSALYKERHKAVSCAVASPQ